MYNRWFSESMADGFKIHIEVYVKERKDAVMLVNKHAEQITKEFNNIAR